MEDKINCLDFDRDNLTKWLAPHAVSSVAVARLLQAIHQQGRVDFVDMDFLNKSARQFCQQQATITLPEMIEEQHSFDGTRKWLLRLSDRNVIETVFIPENTRGTLCVSSQAGCALNCRFCATAQQGFSRNLTVAEIIGQLHFANQCLATQRNPKPVTNVVLMGMGEPLLNFDHVVSAMHLMLDDFAYGLAKRRVTLSTSGVVPAMRRLREVSDVALAVSLHAPNNALRNQLVPINRKYPLEQLLPVCRDYFSDQPQRCVIFEYVMLDGINDTPAHAKELCECLNGMSAKINLIPFNPVAGVDYRCSSEVAIKQFQDVLQQAGHPTIIRRTRGDDIAAACGQLVGSVRRKGLL